ncbi:hypothetical protein FHS89_000196 [Rubricella aquisinus]|jgi:hypothetical protein|uniref:Uncharacterized protein n=1 Tax=Rubricella aquisinus TaxID=2028108 RepID=A0A840WGB9_9RHOB|nr:hypothetical protein [Rubricella aquisinus]MBB5514198.1 hypothetical protein [Rubricella aquisinus]
MTGPSRGEHWFYLCLSVAGFAVIGWLLLTRGWMGPAAIEIVVIGGGFFAWSLWRAIRGLRNGL